MFRKFLRACAITFMVAVSLAAATWVVYLCSERPRQVEMEICLLDGMDGLRESPTAPETVVRALDRVADRVPVLAEGGIEAPPPDRTDASPYGDPSGPWLHLVNPGYEVGYDEQERVPRWAAYKVTRNAGSHGPRPSGFRVDTRTRSRVRAEVYTRSGYDRGHMAPNYALAVCHGEEAQRASFLMTNVVPQLHGLNAGLWKDIELRIAQRYSERYGEVWVANGPVFSADSPARHIGPADTRVRVPDAFWIVVARRSSDGRLHAQAFLVPHREIWRDLDLSRYLVSIDEVERVTGLDLFPLLPEPTQRALEASPAPRAW